jgi:serine/threonine-protein phosphatase 2B catalytic subunit
MGDYVDRGWCVCLPQAASGHSHVLSGPRGGGAGRVFVGWCSYGCEVVLYLLALKVAFPKQITMLRGNHETRGQTMRPMPSRDDDGVLIPDYEMGIHFKGEAELKYGPAFYRACMAAFDQLPLGATIRTNDARFLCLHGGLSPEARTLADLDKIKRAKEPDLTVRPPPPRWCVKRPSLPHKRTGTQGALCDVLWSDPIGPHMDDSDWDGPKRDTVTYMANWDRGAGQFYGITAAREFLQRNHCDGLIRAHEVCHDRCVRACVYACVCLHECCCL